MNPEQPRAVGRGAVALLVALVVAACQVMPPETTPTTSSSPGIPATAGPTTGASESPTGTPAIEPSPPSTEAPADTMAIDWRRLDGNPGLGDLQDSGSGSAFLNAVAFGGYFYLFGELIDGDYALPAVWSSPDGRRWQLMALPDGRQAEGDLAGGVDGVRIRDIAATHSAMVAVGEVALGDGNGAAIWISTDGATWQRVADPDVEPHDFFDMIAASDEGFVAHGARMWFSADGRDWQASMDSGALDLATLLEPRFVRSGSSLTAFARGPYGRYETWRSDNLSDWERIGELPGSRDVEIRAAAAGPHGWLVAGVLSHYDDTSQRTRTQHLWFSTDGQRWESIEPAIGPVSDILAYEAGFIATGFDYNGRGCRIDESDIQGFTWTSVDGREWARMPDEPFDRQRVDELLRSGRTLIGVGLTYLDNAWARGAVWTADLPPAGSAAAEGGDPLPPGVSEPGGCGP